MHRPRRAPLWIAALAVLLHLFAMPLMGVGARAAGMVGHCPMSEASRHDSPALVTHEDHAPHASQALPDGEPAPTPVHHLGMPCCCAAGAASLAAIPASAPELHEPQRMRMGVLAFVITPSLSPRYRWPSLNPRASPFT